VLVAPLMMAIIGPNDEGLYFIIKIIVALDEIQS
jgi:hypothetical protein